MAAYTPMLAEVCDLVDCFGTAFPCADRTPLIVAVVKRRSPAGQEAKERLQHAEAANNCFHLLFTGKSVGCSPIFTIPMQLNGMFLFFFLLSIGGQQRAARERHCKGKRHDVRHVAGKGVWPYLERAIRRAKSPILQIGGKRQGAFSAVCLYVCICVCVLIVMPMFTGAVSSRDGCLHQRARSASSQGCS